MSKTLAKIIGVVAVILAAVLAIGLIYKYTNGFNEDFKTFYVEYDGKQILTTDSKLSLNNSKTHTFNVKYTFDTEKSEPKDYKVKIIPNITRDFDYTVNGEKYLFSKTGEFTSAFGLIKGQTQFSITIPDEFNLQKVLQAVNGGKNTVVSEDAEKNNPYPYRLVVSSYNGKVVYNIDFKITTLKLTLDPDAIIFGGNEKPGTPKPPAEQEYVIEYIFDGDATNLTDIGLDGATWAKAGETVSFSVVLVDSNYSITGASVDLTNSNDIVEIHGGNGSYSFTMPQGNVRVWIYVEYTSPDNTKRYSIEYDSLGWASMDVVNLVCQDKAAAGEKVTFTSTIKSEYAGEYRISSINVELGPGENYIEDLQGSNGSYTFTMPDTETMEDEINEGYMILKFYIVSIEM